ncbi:MAG: hypothetical protein IPL12_09575, partial [Bacteroidetes bacterium]|nr:hypothetical protein [Bacteroidota bacterium]
GGVDEGCEDIVIANGAAAPEALFEINTTNTLSVNFIDNSTNAPTDWLWEFGDGSVSNSKPNTRLCILRFISGMFNRYKRCWQRFNLYEF